MSKILVTGGAGYIGSHFCALLERRGIDYIALDDMSRGCAGAVPSGRLTIGNVGDVELVERLCDENGVDSVVHFAAYAYVGESSENPALYYENNVIQGFRFLEAIRKAGVRKVVFSSSCTTYGNALENPIDETAVQLPTNPYGDTKLAFERLLKSYERAYSLRCAILRYFNASGADPEIGLYEGHEPETHLIPLAIRATGDSASALRVFGNDYETADGTCVRDYIHVNDLADAHIRALTYLSDRGQSITLNLGIGRGYSVLDVIACVERLSGKAVRYEFGERRTGDPPRLVADATQARSLLGWTPAYPELDGIVQTALLGEARRPPA